MVTSNTTGSVWKIQFMGFGGKGGGYGKFHNEQ